MGGRTDDAFLTITSLFTPLARWQVASWQEGNATTVVDRVASTSVIGVLPEEVRAALLDQVRGLLATHPETRGRATLAIPYRTGVFWCTRLGTKRRLGVAPRPRYP